jgi:hypothetical protein
VKLNEDTRNIIEGMKAFQQQVRSSPVVQQFRAFNKQCEQIKLQVNTSLLPYTNMANSVRESIDESPAVQKLLEFRLQVIRIDVEINSLFPRVGQATEADIAKRLLISSIEERLLKIKSKKKVKI